MKVKNKYAAPEAQVFELRMKARILDGSPLGDNEGEQESYGKSYSI